jgi:hypothetical protein
MPAHVQGLVSVVKMVTMLEECSTKSSVLLCGSFLAKGFSAKDIHEEIFPVYGGKCLSLITVHNRVANVSLMTKLKRRRGSG